MIFPSADIMIIYTTAKDLCFRSSERKQQRLKRVVSYIKAYDNNSKGIMMHVFSEGGSNKACELATAYCVTTRRRLPVSALCLDSTPGLPSYSRLCAALHKTFPKVPILSQAGFVLCGAVVGVIWTIYVIKGFKNNVITKTRERLLDHVLFDPSAPRCYFYSAGDALVKSEHIERHADSSPRKGFCRITDVHFRNSGHVRHAMNYESDYWKFVQQTWYNACKDSGVNYVKSHQIEKIQELQIKGNPNKKDLINHKEVTGF
jgi:hypothetical protein